MVVVDDSLPDVGKPVVGQCAVHHVLVAAVVTRRRVIREIRTDPGGEPVGVFHTELAAVEHVVGVEIGEDVDDVRLGQTVGVDGDVE